MAKCTECNDSGTTKHASYGTYDCAAYGCTAAVERTALESAVNDDMAQNGMMGVQDLLWFAHQRGKAAALEQAALIAQDTDIVTQTGCGMTGDDGWWTRSNIVSAIRSLK